MKNPRNNLLLTTALAIGLSGIFLSSLNAAQEGMWKLGKSQSFPKVSLRGFGAVEGTSWSSAGGGSVLEISCEDEAKAKLAQAKFLSDAQLVPKVKLAELSVPRGKISVLEAEGQGIQAALCFGTSVLILSAPDQKCFDALLSECVSKYGTQFVSQAEIEVPMWLDRWDKFGFRFCYYRAGNAPKGKTQADYDILQEFDFAEKSDRSGLICMAKGDETQTAEGFSNFPVWDWALEAAASKKLPVGINLQGYEDTCSWLPSRYPEQMQQKVPQYCGSFYRIFDAVIGKMGNVSHCATTAYDDLLPMMQQAVKEKASYPNVVSVLAVGEMAHSGDLFMEYGPAVDRSYREFLQNKYHTLDALGKSWGRKVASWEDVRLPEIAEFLGWGKQALDLTGTWRVGYEKMLGDAKEAKRNLQTPEKTQSEPAPAEWFSEKFEDSSWPSIVAPGNDIAMFLEKRPAVYRRVADVPQQWLAKNHRVWLYVWDCNAGGGNEVKVFLNGKQVGREMCEGALPHWAAYEVTGVLRAGANQISLRLPQGVLGSRVYLSPDEPKQYPDLGVAKNAEWVDCSAWQQFVRGDQAKKLLSMIRQVEPNKQLVFKAPGAYADDVKLLAQKYGGNFHNTGYMGGFWADDLPAIMRGAQLPFSLEPGGPAATVPDFNKMMGLWATEGGQAIDYFLSLGDIYWDPQIRKQFEDTLPLIKFMGKYHAPAAEVAALYSNFATKLTGYPWGQDKNVNLDSGYWAWNVRAGLIPRFESDGLTDSSFASGDASRYKVIIDSNTSIMDESMIAEIEKYVRNGGTFVTFVQTGRHTPTQKDAWPISKLTGYQVTKIDQLVQNKDSNKSKDWQPERTRKLKLAPGQNIFKGDWYQTPANGLSLKKIAPDAQDLVLWEDGSTAVGMRPLGKGYIVEVGCKFAPRSMSNRIEGKPRPPELAPADLFSELLKWRGIAPIQIKLAKEDYSILMRHYISNNGLYDVWTVWNQNAKAPAENELILPPGTTAKWYWDVQSKTASELSQPTIPLKIAAGQYKIFLTPRNQIAQSPLEWFALQRGWWQGATPPSAAPLSPPPHKLSVDLTKDWAFKPLKDQENATEFLAAKFDEPSWPKINLGIWSGTPAYKDVKHAILKKTFTVPDRWTNGRASLWLASNRGTIFGENEGRVWLDGTLVCNGDGRGIRDANPNETLKPGSKHSLAIEIRTKGSSLAGVVSNAWLWYWMNPIKSIDLKGQWTPSNDFLTYGAPIEIPGAFKCVSFKRKVVIPADQKGNNVLLTVQGEGDSSPGGFLVNGRYIGASTPARGGAYHLQLNIAPWVRYGEENEIEFLNWDMRRGGKIYSISMDFHKPGIYP